MGKFISNYLAGPTKYQVVVVGSIPKDLTLSKKKIVPETLRILLNFVKQRISTCLFDH